MAATSLRLHLRHVEENYLHTENVGEEQQFCRVCSSCLIQVLKLFAHKIKKKKKSSKMLMQEETQQIGLECVVFFKIQ